MTRDEAIDTVAKITGGVADADIADMEQCPEFLYRLSVHSRIPSISIGQSEHHERHPAARDGKYERNELAALLSGGKQAARKLKRAQILLAADAGVSDEDIALSVGVGGSTIYRTKRRFVEGNLKRALSEEPRPGAERKLTGKEEALLVATACSSPPAGRARWTLELLTDELVRLTAHKSVSRETVRRRLSPARCALCSQRFHKICLRNEIALRARHSFPHVAEQIALSQQILSARLAQHDL
jgi:transposase